MAPFEEDEEEGYWDWCLIGGRYDGYLFLDQEMRRQETHHDFSFDKDNERIESNSRLAREVPADRCDVNFFVTDSRWVERLDNPDFANQLHRALDRYPNHHVVVVDAHIASIA